MNVMLIGGTGNIGTAITRGLLARGDTVTHFNRGQSSSEFADTVRLITGDRDDFGALSSAVRDAGPFDCVIDMIAYHPPQVENAIRAVEGNTAQYLFCSTVDVYTKPASVYPITEEAERKASLTFPYAYDKRLCEEMLEGAHAERGFPFTSIRPAATYNDGSCPIALIGSGQALVKRIREGRPVILMGNGNSFWVSAHRDDVAAAFVAAAGSRAAVGQGYHVAGEEWLTWRRYYETVADVLGVAPPPFVCIPTEQLVAMEVNAARP